MTDNYDRIHVFEKAGLGKAPFKYIGASQLGSSCQFCGTGILYQFWVRSTDGKEFYVGSECIYKSGDSGLRRVVEQEVKKFKKTREDERIKAAKGNLEMLKDTFQTLQHPMADRGNFFREKSLYDYAVYLFKWGGQSGKLRAVRMVEGYLKGVKKEIQEVTA